MPATANDFGVVLDYSKVPAGSRMLLLVLPWWQLGENLFEIA
jgi:hypothetical protein